MKKKITYKEIEDMATKNVYNKITMQKQNDINYGPIISSITLPQLIPIVVTFVTGGIGLLTFYYFKYVHQKQ